MGTRTYSRRGVLTAAGRRRDGLEAIDIFGNPIPDRGTVPVMTPEVKRAVETPSKLTNIQKEWREKIKTEVQNNPGVALSDLPPLNYTGKTGFEKIVLGVQALDRKQIKQILAEQEARPISGRTSLEKERNPLLLMAIVQYALNPEDRDVAIDMIKNRSDARGSDMWAAVKSSLLNNSLDYQAKFYGKDEFLRVFWNHWAGQQINERNRFGWSNMHEALSHIGPNKDIPPTSDFWPSNIVPPKPSPLVLRYLEEQYQETQKKLIAMGVPEEGLYLGRGTSQPRGLSMESWSTDRATPPRFAGMRLSGGRNRSEERWGTVPRKYIMGTYQTIPTWVERSVVGKQEHMVLASAYYSKEKDKNLDARPRARAGRPVFYAPINRNV